MLDEIILLDRLNIAGNRGIQLLPARVTAIVEKPHTCYVPTSVGNNLGIPVFTLEGKLIGIRVIQQSAQGTGGKYGPEIIDIILPVTDIAEAAKQAK